MSATRRLRRAVARRNSLIAAKASGCTCAPDIELHGVVRVTMRHDDWCPLVDHVSQLVVYKVPEGCER